MKTFLPFIVIGICVGMYFMYISPLMAEITVLNEKKAEYTNVLQKVKELKEKLDTASASYSSIPEADISKLDKIIPAEFDSVLFLNDLNALASRYSLKVVSFTPTEEKTVSRDGAEESSSELYKTTTINIRLIGSYPQFVSFLKSLELSLQLVDVTGLSITSSNSKTSSDMVYQYSIDAKTYSLK